MMCGEHAGEETVREKEWWGQTLHNTQLQHAIETRWIEGIGQRGAANEQWCVLCPHPIRSLTSLHHHRHPSLSVAQMWAHLQCAALMADTCRCAQGAG